MISKLPLAVFLLGTAACGSGSLTELEGIYTVTTWTDNLASCEVEGPSVASIQNPFFFIKSENIFGSKFVNVAGCETQAECEAKATDADTIHLGGFAFESGSDSAGWTSRSTFAFESNGMCEGSATDQKMTSTAGAIRIESRSTDIAPYAGDCDDDAKIEEAAAGQPCVSLEVMTASFTADF